MKKIVYKDIVWRGSITDLATDVADLLTIGEAHVLIDELNRFLVTKELNDKFCGSGHEDV